MRYDLCKGELEMKKLLAILMTLVLIMMTFAACGESKDNDAIDDTKNSSVEKNDSVKDDEQPTESPSSEDPSKENTENDEPKVKSITAVFDFSWTPGKESQEITVYFPESIEIKSSIINTIKPNLSVIEKNDNKYEVNLRYETEKEEYFLMLTYSDYDFSVDGFTGALIDYDRSTIESSVYYDNKGVVLGKHSENNELRVGKTELCSGFVEEEIWDESGVVTSIYRDPNGKEITEDEYFKEYRKALTYYVNGEEFEGDL